MTGFARLVGSGKDVRALVFAAIFVLFLGAAIVWFPSPKEPLEDELDSNGDAPARWVTGQMDPETGLHHPAPEVREAAAAALANKGIRALPFVPLLIAALDDDQDNVRRQAATTLGMLGPAAESSIPALIAHLQNRADLNRRHYAQALRGMGPAAKDATPALASALEERSPDLSRAVTEALAAIGPGASAAAPALIGALAGQDEDIIRLAESALASFGPEAKAAVPQLILIATNRNLKIPTREQAMATLGKIGPEAEAAVPMLITALDEGDGQPRRDYAIRALDRIGPAAVVAVPVLTKIALDRSRGNWARKSAASAVFNIAPYFAEQIGLECALFDVYLGPIPEIKLEPRPALSESEKVHTKSLISQLSQTKALGASSRNTWRGSGFAAFPASDPFLGYRDVIHRRKSSDAFISLVEKGPDALPFLLEALEDKTLTELEVGKGRRGVGYIGYNYELPRNPVNAVENLVVRAPRSRPDRGTWSRKAYTITVGDVCFVAIGEIVGRQYFAFQQQIPDFTVLNSPAQDIQMRQELSATWSSKDPRAKLFRSLLYDFATVDFYPGVVHQNRLDTDGFQSGAALRLLYYFPKEAIPLVEARLNSLQAQLPRAGDWLKTDEMNGVSTTEFLHSVSWCQAPAIQHALSGIAERTNDPGIRQLLARNAGADTAQE